MVRWAYSPWVVACLCAASLGPAAVGQTTYTWNNSTGNWSVGANWGGTAPTGAVGTDVLAFGGSGLGGYVATNDIAGAPYFLLNRLNLSSSSAAENVLAGNALQFSSAGAALRQSGSGAFRIANPVDFGTAVTFSGAGTGPVTLAGTLSGAGALTFDQAGVVSFAGPANTFTSAITLDAGTLRVAADGSLGAAANTLTFDGGTLQFASGTATNPFTINASRTLTLGAGGGTVDTRGFAVVYNPSKTTSFGTSTGAFTKAGDGTFEIRKAFATSSAPIAVTGGRLRLGNRADTSSNPSGFLANRPIVLNNGTLEIAAGAPNVPPSQTQVTTTAGYTVRGQSAIDLYYTTTPGTGFVNLGTTPFTLDGALAFRAAGSTLSSGSTLQIGGPVTLSGDATFRPEGGVMLNRGAFQSNAQVLVNRIEISGNVAGSFGVTTAGDGTTQLSGTNSFTGPVHVTSGRLSVAGLNALGSATAIAVQPGGQLQFSGPGNIGNSISGTLANSAPITLAGDTTYLESSGSLTTGAIRLDGTNSSLTLNNPIAFAADATIGGQGKTLTLAGPLSGSGRFIKTGNLAVNVTNANPNFEGGFDVRAGQVTLSGNGQGGSGPISVGAGLPQLSSGTVATFSIDNSVTNVTDRVQNAPVTLSGGVLNFVPNASAGSQEHFGTLTVAAPNSVIQTAGNGIFSQLSFSTVSRSPGGTLRFVATSGTLGGPASGDPGIFFADGFDTFASGTRGWAVVVSPDASDGDFVTYSSAAGVRALGGTRPESLNGAAATDNVRSFTAAQPTLTANRTVNSWVFAATTTATQNLGGHTLTLASGGFLRVGNADTTISNGFLTAGADSGGELFLHVSRGSTNLNLNAVVADNGGTAVSVVKAGSGNLVLGAANTFTGDIYIGEGTVTQNAAGALPATARLNLTRGVVDLKGFPTTLAGLSGTPAGVILTTNTTTATALTLNIASGTDVYDGDFRQGSGSQPLSIVKSGAGSFKVTSGTSSYTGTTTVSQGNYLLGAPAPFNGQPGTLGQATSAVVLADANTGSAGVGLLVEAPATTLVGRPLSVQNLGTGTVTIGATAAHRGSVLFSGNVALGRTARLTSDTTGGDVVAFSGVLSGAGGVEKVGTGTVVLAGANTYTGPTTVQAGRLLVNGSTAADSAVAVNSGGTLGGLGTVNGSVAVSNGGTLTGATGGTPGVLTVAGPVAFASGGKLETLIGGPAPGVDAWNYSQVVAGNSFDLSNSPALSLHLVNGYVPGAADRIFLVNKTSAGGYGGSFAGAPEGATVAFDGYVATISYTGDYATLSLTGGNDVVLYNFQPVPEPAGVLALALAGGLLARLARRRLAVRPPDRA